MPPSLRLSIITLVPCQLSCVFVTFPCLRDALDGLSLLQTVCAYVVMPPSLRPSIITLVPCQLLRVFVTFPYLCDALDGLSLR